MNSAKISVLIVDDQEALLKMLRLRLALEDDIEVVGEARNGQMALMAVMRLQPDVVVMDIETTGLNGIAATKAIRAGYPDGCVIWLSMHDNPQLRAEALECGAWACVEKRGGANNLVDEIRRARRTSNRSIHY